MTSEHTIVNIRAHDTSEDERQQHDQNNGGIVAATVPNGTEDDYAMMHSDGGGDNNRVHSRSARVEYHSDRDRGSSRFSSH